MPTSSLSARLLISVSVLMLFFFGVTIVVLDTAFRKAGVTDPEINNAFRNVMNEQHNLGA